MSDRIDELVAEAEFLNDNGCDKCEIVAQLATIARKAEAEADKWRKVAEWLANQLVTAKVRWPVLVGAWSLPSRAEDVWIEAALAAVEQEEAE